jgi:hypothetical protein
MIDIGTIRVKLIAEGDELKAEVESTTDALQEFGDETENVQEKVQNLSGSQDKQINVLTEIRSGLALVNGALQTVQQGYDATVGFTIDYAMSVDQLSRSLGTSAEEASRLIQVTDDVGISMASLETGFRAALDKGLVPSIDTLKGLAEEFQGIEDPAARAQRAMEIFGQRAGLEFLKILEQTPEAIQGLSDAADSAGMVIDEKLVGLAEEGRQKIDELNDQIDALKLNLGAELLGASNEGSEGLAGWIGNLNRGVTANHAVNDAIDAGSVSLQAYGAFLATIGGIEGHEAEVKEWLARQTYQYSGAVMDGAEALEYWSNQVTTATDKSYENAGALMDGADAQEYWAEQVTESHARIQAAAEATAAWEAANERLSESQGDVLQRLEEMQTPLEKLFGALSTDMGSPMESFISDLNFFMAGGGQYEAQFAAIKQAFFDGKITPEEAEEFTGELFVAFQNTMVEAGQTTGEEAAKNVSDALGVPLEEAQTMLDTFTSSLDVVAAMQHTISLRLELDDRGNVLALIELLGGGITIPTGGGAGGGGGGTGGGAFEGGATYGGKQAEGGTYHVSEPTWFLAGEAGGETAAFTPDGAGGGGGMVINVTVYAPGGDPGVVHEAAYGGVMAAARAKGLR